MKRRTPPLSRLEKRIGYAFDDRDLLRQALTHCSFANEARDPIEDNEPMEFLGDAILSFVVSDELCRRYPDFREGRLSRTKASLVQTSTLAGLAQEIDLGDYLRLGRGEEKSGGHEKESILANAFEALIASIYRDGGIRSVRAFIRRSLKDLLEDAGNGERIVDPKSAIQERLQARGLGIPHYEVVKEEGPDHHKTFHVELLVGGKTYGQGDGRSKKLAQQRAARKALRRLDREEEADDLSEKAARAGGRRSKGRRKPGGGKGRSASGKKA